jgi:hypothetical protein
MPASGPTSASEILPAFLETLTLLTSSFTFGICRDEARRIARGASGA